MISAPARFPIIFSLFFLFVSEQSASAAIRACMPPMGMELRQLRAVVPTKKVADLYIKKYVLSEIGADAQEVVRLLGVGEIGNSAAEDRAIALHFKTNYGDLSKDERDELRSEIAVDLEYAQALSDIVRRFEDLKLDYDTVRQYFIRKAKQRNGRVPIDEATKIFDESYRSFRAAYSGPLPDERSALAAYSAAADSYFGGMSKQMGCYTVYPLEAQLRWRIDVVQNGPTSSDEAKYISRGKITSVPRTMSNFDFLHNSFRGNPDYMSSNFRLDLWREASRY